MTASMDDRQLWRLSDAADPGAAVECVMVSCCAGAELQIRRTTPGAGEAVIVLRELYPTKSDLYERARMLRAEFEGLANRPRPSRPAAG